MNRIQTCASTVLVVGVLLASTTADADAAPQPVKPVKGSDDAGTVALSDLTVVKAERVGARALRFMTSDGVVWRASACVDEDSRNCWWDAERRGNRTGTPVVKISGRTLAIEVPIR